jgi:hypothetical protein
MKIDMKSRISIGCDEHSKGYRLYDTIKCKTFMSKDVDFVRVPKSQKFSPNIFLISKKWRNNNISTRNFEKYKR